MSERKPVKLEDVEWDGLLLDIVMVLNKVLPMERTINSRWLQWLSDFVKKVNPCHSSEESLAWRIMCYLFPDCWCCSGIRGFIYGVVFMLVTYGLMEIFL